MSIYDFKVGARDGSEVSLSKYEGKVLLIVNTAVGVADAQLREEGLGTRKDAALGLVIAADGDLFGRVVTSGSTA